MQKPTTANKRKSSTKFIQVNTDIRSISIMENIERLKSILMLDNHVDVYLPNEIFKDFQSCPLFKNWQQIAFAYSYYYVACYLYRNCIYAKVVDVNEINLTNIRKNLLGVAGKTMSDIYKKNGILDTLGYTATYNDFPIYAILKKNNMLEGFHTHSELKTTDNYKGAFPPYATFKFPVKAFYNTPIFDYLSLIKMDNDESNDLLSYCDGHFFNVSASHKIQIETFIACMSNQKLGYKGFYLYGFYRRQSDQYKGGYNASIKQIQDIIPISEKTLLQYHQELEAMNLITKRVIPHSPNTYKAKSIIPTIEI
jgi:hypothetical protein